VQQTSVWCLRAGWHFVQRWRSSQILQQSAFAITLARGALAVLVDSNDPAWLGSALATRIIDRYVLQLHGSRAYEHSPVPCVGNAARLVGLEGTSEACKAVLAQTLTAKRWF
jgi:hypothetical protein